MKTELTPYEKVRVWLENLILTRLVPSGGPGPFFRYLFKVPILFYRLGLGHWVGPHFLLLTTRGRKTGKTRYTPLEFDVDQATGAYVVMAGWGGKTDWFRNALAQPQVTIQIGRDTFRVVAESLPDEEVARRLMEIVRRAPRMRAVFQRWTDQPLDDSLESYTYAARFFPTLALKPAK